MNISQQEALVFVLLGVSLAFFGRLTFFMILDLYRKFLFELEYMKHPRLVPHNVRQVCQTYEEEFHVWRSVQLVLRGLPPGSYKVCTNCGSILGNSEFMVSNEVLDKIAEADKLAAEKAEMELQIQVRIQQLTDSYVDHYIAKTFVKEVNDTDFADKLRALSRYTVTSLANASEKVAAELTGASELEDKYKAWPKALGVRSNQGGNA